MFKAQLTGWIYFLYQKKKNREIFSAQIPGDRRVSDCVKSFNYSRAVVNWFVDKGDDTIRIEYPLDQNSVVFDVGGYIGDWSEKIYTKYHCYIHIFEPQPDALQILYEKYKGKSKIFIYPFGLAEKDKKIFLNISGISSSVYGSGEKKATIELRDIERVLTDLNAQEINLIKINIEGGEYDLLLRMIETRNIKRFQNILVQFHEAFPNAHSLRRKIRQELSPSHRLIWDYPFVWESWKRLE